MVIAQADRNSLNSVPKKLDFLDEQRQEIKHAQWEAGHNRDSINGNAKNNVEPIKSEQLFRLGKKNTMLGDLHTDPEFLQNLMMKRRSLKTVRSKF